MVDKELIKLYNKVLTGEIASRQEIIEELISLLGKEKETYYRTDLTLLLAFIDKPDEYKFYLSMFVNLLNENTINTASKMILKSESLDVAKLYTHQVTLQERLLTYSTGFYMKKFDCYKQYAYSKKNGLIRKINKIESLAKEIDEIDANFYIWNERVDWSDTEKGIIEENAHKTAYDIAHLLPNRSLGAIRTMLSRTRSKIKTR